jgi:hypothetical protein
MATIPGEIADALVALLVSPTTQAALISAIEAGEVPIENALEGFVNGLKAGGALGLVLSATKGSIDAEIVALFKQLPATTIAAYLTNLAKTEAKALGG